MHTWLLAHNLQDQYYWWGDSLDIKCKTRIAVWQAVALTYA